MKISVIIPVYNVAPYIADCLRSVMQQSWQGPLECVLVDDCGTDDSMQVAEQLFQDYDGPVAFKIVRHEQNRGLSAARNTGIDAATGDYVYFLDSDDEITPDCIEALASPLQRHPYDLTISDYRIVGSDMPKVPLRLSDGAVLQGTEVLHAYRLQDWYMMSVNKLYRRAFLNANGLRFREGIIHEDELWSFQMACMAQSMAVVGRETYIYKIREGSITVKAFSPKRSRSFNLILQAMCAFSENHHLQDNVDVHHIIQNFRIACLNTVWLNAPDSLKPFYREQRSMMTTRWTDCCRLDGTDIRKQIRDFHLALPVCLALPYLKVMLIYYK